LFIFLSCSVKLVHPTSVQTDKDISKKFPGWVDNEMNNNNNNNNNDNNKHSLRSNTKGNGVKTH
jgi:hypothetical protein